MGIEGRLETRTTSRPLNGGEASMDHLRIGSFCGADIPGQSLIQSGALCTQPGMQILLPHSSFVLISGRAETIR